jgi:BlaI family transcriptional regulator, penicillinase repressor
MNPEISDAESQVMQLLWAKHPQSADDIVAALQSEKHWQPPTIKTLLNRLLTKGAISAQAEGRKYLYAPVLQKADWLAGQTQGFLGRLFQGRVAPLVAHFSEQGQLSDKDVAEIKAVIAQLESHKKA